MSGTRALGRWSPPRRRLSPDEAESVLERHFRSGFVEAKILLGCYVVWWWRIEGDSPALADDAGAESPLSFEEAIRELALKRPDLIREPLDGPGSLLRHLLGEDETDMGAMA